VPISLEDLSEPDTNTAVVVLDSDFRLGATAIYAGTEQIYCVRPDRIPHVTLVERIVSTDTTSVVQVISDLYAAGPVRTDGSVNLFRFTGADGTEYRPVVPCELDVVAAYVLGTPSVQELRTVCRVRSSGDVSFTVFVSRSDSSPWAERRKSRPRSRALR
jgi:hypothetical protein